MKSSFGNYAVVVYGATMSGVAAAANSSSLLGSTAEVLIVNPQPGWGGTGGAGGWNMWDTREWQHQGTMMTPQGGTFRQWYDREGQAYSLDGMQETLQNTVRNLDNVDVLDYWDISSVNTIDGAIRSIDVTPLKRVQKDTTATGSTVSITGEIFVDASETGRLTRLANVPLCVGREDRYDDRRQMATVFMFQIEDVDWATIQQCRSPDGQSTYNHATSDRSGRRMFWGGYWEATNNDAVDEFENAYPRLGIKALNAVEEQEGQFWLKTMLIYDVDGRYDARERNKIISYNGVDRPWDRDQARKKALRALEDDAFIAAIRSFPGLGSASLVTENGSVKTGETLHLCETVHAQSSEGFALTGEHVENAGTDSETGADSEHYQDRIGLAFYWMNSHGYTGDPMTDENKLINTGNPVYLPYHALTTDYCSNLLIPGYATNVSSEAWLEVRMLPNLCVLGDAAGVAAAVSYSMETPPTEFERAGIDEVQRLLRSEVDAVLDKRVDVGVVA